MTSSVRRLLLVHAHPDDESITTAITMAKYVAQGTDVTLVTCTAGEEGEVRVAELSHLAADQTDSLGPHRADELAAAMKELGVTDHRFLGGLGRFRDSGMKWTESGAATASDEEREDTFWSADLGEAADLLVEVIREVRPHVLVTYDDFGGYGHPDHVKAHRVAHYAAALAGAASYRADLGESWAIAKIYWAATPKSQLAESIRAVRAAGDSTSFEGMDPDNLPWGIDDDQLSAVIEGADFSDAKMAAMRAHATQITVDGPFFSVARNVGQQVWANEYFRLAVGNLGPLNEAGLETDLFAGLD